VYKYESKLIRVCEFEVVVGHVQLAINLNDCVISSSSQCVTIRLSANLNQILCAGKHGVFLKNQLLLLQN
jgi:hypothetical protein